MEVSALTLVIHSKLLLQHLLSQDVVEIQTFC